MVCPSTLVAHWPFEISKFVAPDVLRPLAYHGTPAERTALRRQLAQHDVLVMSYESLRAGACGFVQYGAGRENGRGWTSAHGCLNVQRYPAPACDFMPNCCFPTFATCHHHRRGLGVFPGLGLLRAG